MMNEMDALLQELSAEIKYMSVSELPHYSTAIPGCIYLAVVDSGEMHGYFASGGEWHDLGVFETDEIDRKEAKHMKPTNCKNCGAVLPENGKCLYCGSIY